MKKRLLALLLTVCTLAALVTGLSSVASAANDITGDTISGYVIDYQLAKDDTVLKVCNKLGIDFYKNQAQITKINNITDYSKLPVGKVVWLPATSAGTATDYYILKTHTLTNGDDISTLLSKYGVSTNDALLGRLNTNLASPTVGSTLTIPLYKGSKEKIENTATNAGTVAVTGTVIGSVTGVTGATTTTVAGGTAAAANGNVAYYLIPYVMNQGDTVGAVCTALGISFAQNQALISRINGITNYNRIAAGRTILLPSASPAAGGTSYQVVAHLIQQGETALSICNSYGVSYNNNLTLLKGLNNNNNLNAIMAGNIFYVPVAGTYSGGGSVIPGGGGSVIPGGGTTGGVAQGTTYALSKDDADNGSFKLKADGVEVSAAAAGRVITIVCNGAAGYAQDTITVHKTGDSSKTVAVVNNTFTMPDYPVTVKVTFGKATNYKILPVGSTNGSYELYVDEKIVIDKTYAGAAVTVKTQPDNGYVLDKIDVFKIGDSDKKVTVTDGKFTMPKYGVQIEVTFKPGKVFEYPVAAASAPLHGSFELKVDGVVVSKAAEGKTVHIAAYPDKDYKVDTMKATYVDENGETVELKINYSSFVMPTFNEKIPEASRKVTVEVTFIKSATYVINIKNDSNGSGNSVYAMVNNSSVGRAEEGRVLVFTPRINKTGYVLKSITITYGSTTYTISDPAADAKFTMPAAAITVTPTFVNATPQALSYTADPTTAGTVTFMVKSVSGATSALEGDTVNMTITPTVGYKLKAVKAIYTYNGEDTEVKITGNNFTMPAYAVKVKAEFERPKLEITTKVEPSVSDANVSLYSDSQLASEAAPGATVLIKISPADGKQVKSIKVTYVDSNGDTQEVPVTSDRTFVMPEYKVTLTIEMKDGKFNINSASTVNGTFTIEDDTLGKVIEKAEKGETIHVKTNPADGFVVKEVYYTVGSDSTHNATTEVTANQDYTFTMPGKQVTVYAVFEGNERGFATPVIIGSGTVKLYDADHNELTPGTDKVKVGEKVFIEAKPASGYKLDTIEVKNAAGNRSTPVAADGSFTMQDYQANITVTFKALVTNLNVNKNIVDYGTAEILVNGNPYDSSTGATEGDTITVNVTPLNGYAIDEFTVVTISDNKPVTVINGNTFIMPFEDVRVKVTFKQEG